MYAITGWSMSGLQFTRITADEIPTRAPRALKSRHFHSNDFQSSLIERHVFCNPPEWGWWLPLSKITISA